MTINNTAVQWFKSSYSSEKAECVEVAHLSIRLVGVRDSKNPQGPSLSFTPTEWTAFTTTIQSGHLDLPA
jgi:hypothetical protein